MDPLPSEIVVHIAKYLDAVSLVRLQLACPRFLTIGRDNNLWREHCFEQSLYLERLLWRRELKSRIAAGQQSTLQPPEGSEQESQGTTHTTTPTTPTFSRHTSSHERVRILANWDPSYVNEKLDWYSEYIHRHAPIQINWVQRPQHRESPSHESLDVRGMSLFASSKANGSQLAVAPLDDGSLCLWQVDSTSSERGRIVGRSNAGILFVDGAAAGSRTISTGVVECVAVNASSNKAYVAVQNRLTEIDLETLAKVSSERFPCSISAISEARGTTPLTIGTNLSLHMHDPRAPSLYMADSYDIVESSHNEQKWRTSKSVRNVFDPPEIQYAPLFHPGPLSIVHIPISEDSWDGNGEIYVAGRFPSILNYDRRFFPKLRGTIHSGGRLCSMTHVPMAFSSWDREQRRQGELSLDQAGESRSWPGKTLVACGEYNSKGSLELYGLSPLPQLTTMSTDSGAGKSHDAVFKNRQTSSSSKLLSVSPHGARLVFSDGSGNLKWVERDGFTEVRRWNTNQGAPDAPRGIFGNLGNSYAGSGSDDIIRKIVPISSEHNEPYVNREDLLLWTGDKLGLLSFSGKPGFTVEGFEDGVTEVDQTHKEREERIYAETMRRALERQADEVRFVRGLGLGLGFDGHG